MEYNSKSFDKTFRQIYGNDENVLKKQFTRYYNLINKYSNIFESEQIHFFSTPGRTELGGNHTDHNHGAVLAASVNLDSIAVASKNNDNKVVLYSEGYDDSFIIDLHQLDVMPEEKSTTSALIRGIAAQFKKSGYTIGGFNACITSDVLPGSGLSSSASIEVLIASIFNNFFNDNIISPIELAKIGQYAENEYFGKPCGLMDQIACAVGGIVTIDFKNPIKPNAKKVNFDFNKENYNLLIVDTGGSHADLTDEYAAVPDEMKAIANSFNSEVLRDVSFNEFLLIMSELRKKEGDRAVLRSLHFFRENERVDEQVAALESGDYMRFLNLVKESGNSSFKWLQNIYSTKNVKEQGMTLALALSEKYISEINAGACRVHGGGFAGTIQIFLPNDSVEKYVEDMNQVFGIDSVKVLNICNIGSITFGPENLKE